MTTRAGQVTLTDVSRKAGVSMITASRVLNGSAGPVGIREETRRKVMRAAESLGYRTHLLARAMRTGRTGNIGLIVVRRPDGRVLTDDQFYVQVIEGVEHELLAGNYSILISIATPEEQEAVRLPRIAAAGFVDGLLFLGVHDRPYLQRLAHQYRRMVVIDEAGLRGVPSVFTANRDGGRLAARHLCGLGHWRLAAIKSDVAGVNLEQRLAGIQGRSAARGGFGGGRGPRGPLDRRRLHGHEVAPGRRQGVHGGLLYERQPRDLRAQSLPGARPRRAATALHRRFR